LVGAKQRSPNDVGLLGIMFKVKVDYLFLCFLDFGKLDPRLAFGGLEKSWFPKSGADW